MQAPTHLRHQPIIAVSDYERIDGNNRADQTDVRAISIGQAQYNEDEISLKVWRHTGEKWSRQSEELPIHRNLDLSLLFIHSLLNTESSPFPGTDLQVRIVDRARVGEIQNYYNANTNAIRPRLEELRTVLNNFFERGL